jgi:hypothetical protein
VSRLIRCWNGKKSWLKLRGRCGDKIFFGG